MPRDKFLPAEEQANAALDIPLPIGHGQTNSQPSTVRMMLRWLDAQSGENVLDVGSGSGWTTGMLAHIVGKKGRVTAVEKVPELVKFGRDNCHHFGIKNIEFYEARSSMCGWPRKGPYDRILVSASATHIPPELLEQLAPGGRMVIPVRDTMYVLQKDKQGKITRDEYYGFAFVPLL
jgi:protein-L-isoaspartate(D-aspartate) O-methyltransferase